MLIEKQVTSLELSKAVKEAGYPQESVWYWFQMTWANGIEYVIRSKNYEHRLGKMICAAPTVAEWGCVLPERLSIPDNQLGRTIGGLYCKKIGEIEWMVFYTANLKALLAMTCEKKEADARAAMYLCLKKEGLIK